jgi:hypothetical protein
MGIKMNYGREGEELQEDQDWAVFEYHDEDGVLLGSVDMIYRKSQDNRYTLRMGNYWHEFDEDGELLSSTEIL